MLEPQVIGRCRVGHEEGRVYKFAAVRPKHPRPLRSLIVDHDHTVSDLEKDRCVYANERKEHRARVVPHVALSVARVISYALAGGVEPLMRVVLSHRGKVTILCQKEFDLLDQ